MEWYIKDVNTNGIFEFSYDIYEGYPKSTGFKFFELLLIYFLKKNKM